MEFSVLNGAYKKDGDSLIGSLAIGEGMVLNQKGSDSDWIKEEFFYNEGGENTPV